MSTSDLRERLRRLAERTAKDLEESQRRRGQTNQSIQSDGDKENSIVTAPTNTRMTRTAPTKLLKNVTVNKTPVIPEVVTVEEIPKQSGISTATAVAPSSSVPRSKAANAKARIPAAIPSKPVSATPLKPVAAATVQCMSTATKERHQSVVMVPTARSNRSATKSAEKDDRKRRTVSAHAEHSGAAAEASGKAAKIAASTDAHALRRSESTSSTRPNLYIHVNNRPYVVIDLLGKGGSSKVYQVLDEEQKKLRAIKCVDLSEADDACRSAYLNEIKLLLSLRDTGCVVEMFDYELRGDLLYVIMEKGDTDLATFLKTRRNQIDDIFIRFYWSEMLKCVQTIHKKGIVHSDLKPANFLLVGGNLKLIDFGIASAIPTNKTSVVKDTQMGTLSYMPPEAIACSNANSYSGKEIYKVRRKSDVWALGCILYNMVYGHTPYQMYANPIQRMHAILHKPIVFEKIEDADLMDVLKRCLTKDVNQRASVEELQKHPYLSRKNRTTMDESMVLHDDNDFMKLAEDLRNCTPRTSSRKLRDLMQKRNTTGSKNSANKFT